MSAKVAVITGVSGGLGNHVVLSMLQAGYNVAAIQRNNDFDNSLFKKEADLSNVSYKEYSADLSSEIEIEKATSSLIQDFKQVNAIINLAGISYSGMSWKQPLEKWNEVLALNLTGPMLLSQQLIPVMKKQASGSIIYFSSIVAHRPVVGTSAYAASKAALEGLTRVQAIELGTSNINVNCIAPGYFDAGMIREIDDKMRSELIHETPLKSLGNPKSIAETVLYLCSEGGRFTTGQVLHVNGGLYI